MRLGFRLLGRGVGGGPGAGRRRQWRGVRGRGTEWAGNDAAVLQHADGLHAERIRRGGLYSAQFELAIDALINLQQKTIKINTTTEKLRNSCQHFRSFQKWRQNLRPKTLIFHTTKNLYQNTSKNQKNTFKFFTFHKNQHISLYKNQKKKTHTIMTTNYSNKLIDWLIDWLIQSIGWLIDLIDWLIDYLIFLVHGCQIVFLDLPKESLTSVKRPPDLEDCSMYEISSPSHCGSLDHWITQ